MNPLSTAATGSRKRTGKGPRSNRRGSTTVEFAFMVPVLFGLVLGIFELGRGLMVAHLLGEAARTGCRVAVVEGKSTSDVTSAVSSALSGAGISGDSVTVTVNGASRDVSSAQAGDKITVLVSVPASAITWVPGGRYLKGVTLSGQDTLRRE